MSSPASSVLCRRSDFLRPVPRRFVDLRFAVPPCRPVLRHERPGRPPLADQGFGTTGTPRRLAVVQMELSGPPEFPGNPNASMPCSPTPVGPRRRRYALRCCLPPAERRRLPHILTYEAQSHGLLTRCLRFAAQVALAPRKTRFRWLPAFPDGLGPAGFRCKVSVATSSLPELSRRTPQDENVGIPAIERRAFIEGIFNLRATDQPDSGRWNSGRSGGASHSSWANGRRRSRPPVGSPGRFRWVSCRAGQ